LSDTCDGFRNWGLISIVLPSRLFLPRMLTIPISRGSIPGKLSASLLLIRSCATNRVLGQGRVSSGEVKLGPEVRKTTSILAVSPRTSLRSCATTCQWRGEAPKSSLQKMHRWGPSPHNNQTDNNSKIFSACLANFLTDARSGFLISLMSYFLAVTFDVLCHD